MLYRSSECACVVTHDVFTSGQHDHVKMCATKSGKFYPRPFSEIIFTRNGLINFVFTLTFKRFSKLVKIARMILDKFEKDSTISGPLPGSLTSSVCPFVCLFICLSLFLSLSLSLSLSLLCLSLTHSLIHSLVVFSLFLVTRATMTEEKKYLGEDYVCILRGIIALTSGLVIYNRETVQKTIDDAYSALLQTRFYNSVYFETFFVVICYTAIVTFHPKLVSKYTYFDVFKISPSVTYQTRAPLEQVTDVLYYTGPLMILDTFIVKKYCGVEPAIWEEKRKDWIQSTRALPSDAPSIFEIFYQLVLSIIVYDFLFFCCHFALHKNYFLYRYIHKYHHDHETVHVHVTGQLSVSERLVLVLSANFALKLFNSHPLTRTIFIPIFMGLLIDNHSGYDMPFGIHRLIPFGIAGGSVKHYEHHMTGKRAYQPIFTYLDNLVEHYKKKKND